ncbi:MAG: hypothetical protein GHCLOJNM_01283 [bacterium]|nr:hypothetical protein [bacterium]
MDNDGPRRFSSRLSQKAGDYGQAFRQLGVALSIPGLLLAGPLVGYGLGWCAKTYLGCPEWSVLVGLLLGLASGIRETVKVLKQLSAEMDTTNKKKKDE